MIVYTFRKMTIIRITILAIAVIAIILLYNGIIWPNNLFVVQYSIYGIDVSHHQKDINWELIAENEKIKFAFIKATEGKDFRDKYFRKNWEEASKTGIYIGAYHYFKVTSTGKEQAENFIGIVPKGNGFLPPVIDIEEKGLEKEEFQKELHDFINIINQHYGQKPILYVVYPLYNQYIKGDYEEYPIWIRDILKPPSLSDKREWLFWQYCNRGKLYGINTFVDLNVYKGNLNELKMLLSD